MGPGGSSRQPAGVAQTELDALPPAAAVVPLDALITRLSRSLRFSMFAAFCGLVGVALVYITILPSGWLLIILAAAGAHQAVVATALRICRRGAVARAAVIFCLADWAVVLVVIVITPQCAPAILPIIIARIVSTLPYLRQGALLRLIAASLALGVAVGWLSRVDLVHLTDDLPNWVVSSFIVFFVPLGIAIVGLDLWQHSTSLLDTTQQALAANTALHNSQLRLQEQADELRRSRARLATTADTERRRLERDLHDGAQQTLISLCLGIQLLIDREPSHPPRRADLCRLENLAQEAITELREIAHGVYPPVLATQGLAAALRAVLHRCQRPVTADIAPVPRCPPELEAAVYFCCREALQNIDKHAGPDATAWLRLFQVGDTLRFAVGDNGRGFDLATGQGQGLLNMLDRVAAVGGNLNLTSTPGAGTTVSGVVPLPAVIKSLLTPTGGPA